MLPFTRCRLPGFRTRYSPRNGTIRGSGSPPDARASWSDCRPPQTIACRQQTSGRPPAVIPQMGGSICNELFTDLLGLPAIWIPHSYTACSQHAPDEHVLAPLCREALGLMAGLWWDLAEEAPARATG